MMDSRGGITGGASIRDFLTEYAGQGYTTTFIVRPAGRLECRAFGERVPAGEVAVRSMRRVEGVSDPSDMSIVGALECPRCGALGTATFCHGAHCPPEDGEVLRALQNQRHARSETLRGQDDDASLVSDSGWLRGPERG